MTTETKTFINPEDIVAIRVECLHCESSSVVPMKSSTQTYKLATQTVCPYCRTRWFHSERDSRYQVIQEFIAILESFRTTMAELPDQGSPCRLSLEVTPSALGHGASGKG